MISTTNSAMALWQKWWNETCTASEFYLQQQVSQIGPFLPLFSTHDLLTK